jgi:hypothetical protein
MLDAGADAQLQEIARALLGPDDAAHVLPPAERPVSV